MSTTRGTQSPSTRSNDSLSDYSTESLGDRSSESPTDRSGSPSRSPTPEGSRHPPPFNKRELGMLYFAVQSMDGEIKVDEETFSSLTDIDPATAMATWSELEKRIKAGAAEALANSVPVPTTNRQTIGGRKTKGGKAAPRATKRKRAATPTESSEDKAELEGGEDDEKEESPKVRKKVVRKRAATPVESNENEAELEGGEDDDEEESPKVRKKAVRKKATPKKAVPKKAVPKKAVPKKAVPKKATPKKATPKKAKVVTSEGVSEEINKELNKELNKEVDGDADEADVGAEKEVETYKAGSAGEEVQVA